MVDSVTKPLPNTLAFRLVLFNVFILVIYHPPSNTPIGDKHLTGFLTYFCSDKEVVIIGDFDLPSIGWIQDDQTLGCLALDKMFLETFLSLGLTQWVLQPTFPQSGNILDIVLTTERDGVGTLDVLPPLPSCDHCPTSFEYEFSDECAHIFPKPFITEHGTGESIAQYPKGYLTYIGTFSFLILMCMALTHS